MDSNVNILQILSGYLCEDTLVHLYEMTNEKYYLQLAQRKTGGPIYSIYSISSMRINGLDYSIKGASIKIRDSHGNKIRLIAIDKKLYLVSAYIADIYKYPETMRVFKQTFKELILGQIEICSNIKKLVEIKIGPHQVFSVSSTAFSYYDNGTLISI